MISACVQLALLLPLILLVIDFATGNLSANPIRDIQLRTGRIAINILMASLAVTPVYIVSGFSWILRFRRILGLYAFLYILLHFINFIWIDYGFDFSILKQDLFEKRYAIIGFAAFLLLLPLAITSFFRLRQIMGSSWKKIHYLVYPAGVAAIVHYLWQEKIAMATPFVYGIILLVLLIVRIPIIQHYLSHHLPWLQKRNHSL